MMKFRNYFSIIYESVLWFFFLRKEKWPRPKPLPRKSTRPKQTKKQILESVLKEKQEEFERTANLTLANSLVENPDLSSKKAFLVSAQEKEALPLLEGLIILTLGVPSPEKKPSILHKIQSTKNTIYSKPFLSFDDMKQIDPEKLLHLDLSLSEEILKPHGEITLYLLENSEKYTALLAMKLASKLGLKLKTRKTSNEETLSTRHHPS